MDEQTRAYLEAISDVKGGDPRAALRLMAAQGVSGLSQEDIANLLCAHLDEGGGVFLCSQAAYVSVHVDRLELYACNPMADVNLRLTRKVDIGGATRKALFDRAKRESWAVGEDLAVTVALLLALKVDAQSWGKAQARMVGRPWSQIIEHMCEASPDGCTTCAYQLNLLDHLEAGSTDLCRIKELAKAVKKYSPHDYAAFFAPRLCKLGIETEEANHSVLWALEPK